jgi:hypothetical protein
MCMSSRYSDGRGVQGEKKMLLESLRKQIKGMKIINSVRKRTSGRVRRGHQDGPVDERI